MSPRRKNSEKSLVDKIAEAFASVGRLQKRGTNETRHYSYSRASDVLDAVRLQLLKRGILCCPTEAPAEYHQVGTSNGGEQITECRLQVTYVFRSKAEALEPMTINGVGRDVEDKALYKAQTGAQKALLKRFGLIADVEDDPEHDGRTSETIDDVAPMRPAREPKKVTERQIAAFHEACVQTNKSADEISGYLLTAHKVTKIEDLGRGKPFTDAIVWATDGQGTVNPKPQAVATQSALPLRAAQSPVELRIGNKTIPLVPDQAAYSV